MQIVLNKTFEALPIDFYEKDNAFYLSRRQIGEALEYKDEKSTARLISRNKEKIGNGITVTLPQKEGDRTVAREVELFNTKQVLRIISCSKAPKAVLFMDFILETVEQLLTGKAELKFHNPEDEKAYLRSVKSLIGTCSSIGIPRALAGKTLIEAKINGTDPNVAILNVLQDREKLEKDKRRRAVNYRVQYVAALYFGKDSNVNAYEEGWHEVSRRIRFHIGYDLMSMRDKLKKKGVVPPSYLDYFEQFDCWDAVDKVLKEMLKEVAKRPSNENTTA